VNIAIDIPDDIGQALAAQAGGVSRAVLEAVAIEAYRSGAITSAQVQQMLVLRSRWETDHGFLPRPVCFRRHGNRHAVHSSRERDCASYGRVDDAAVPRVSGVRSSLSIRHPRPRCHLLVGLGRRAEGLRCTSSADAVSSTQGERLLRTAGWRHPAGVSRLPNPSIGGPLEADPSPIRPPLQWGTPTLVIRTGNSGATLSQGSGRRTQARAYSTPVLRGLLHEYGLKKEAA
jgi:hypothetical protein